MHMHTCKNVFLHVFVWIHACVSAYTHMQSYHIARDAWSAYQPASDPEIGVLPVAPRTSKGSGLRVLIAGVTSATVFQPVRPRQNTFRWLALSATSRLVDLYFPDLREEEMTAVRLHPAQKESRTQSVNLSTQVDQSTSGRKW